MSVASLEAAKGEGEEPETAWVEEVVMDRGHEGGAQADKSHEKVFPGAAYSRCQG